jgi:hypothetical protein
MAVSIGTETVNTTYAKTERTAQFTVFSTVNLVPMIHWEREVVFAENGTIVKKTPLERLSMSWTQLLALVPEYPDLATDIASALDKATFRHRAAQAAQKASQIQARLTIAQAEKDAADTLVVAAEASKDAADAQVVSATAAVAAAQAALDADPNNTGLQDDLAAAQADLTDKTNAAAVALSSLTSAEASAAACASRVTLVQSAYDTADTEAEAAATAAASV